MGLLESIAHIFNEALAPAGIRLFPNGPYPDAGLGDKALSASQQLQQAGQSILGNAVDALPALYSQLATLTGTQDPYPAPAAAGPLTTGGGTATRTPPTAPNSGPGGTPFQAPGSNPFALTGPYATQFNNQAGALNAARQNALSTLEAGLAARGLPQSSLQAATAHLNDLFDSQINTLGTNLATTQFGTKLNTLEQGIGQAQQQISEGGGLINQNVNTLENQAQAATQRQNQANAALGSALGLATGGLTRIPGVGPGGVPGGTPPITTPAQAGAPGATGQNVPLTDANLNQAYNTALVMGSAPYLSTSMMP